MPGVAKDAGHRKKFWLQSPSFYETKTDLRQKFQGGELMKRADVLKIDCLKAITLEDSRNERL